MGVAKHMYIHMHMFMSILPFLKATVVMTYFLLLFFEFIVTRLPPFVQYHISIIGNRFNL